MLRSDCLAGASGGRGPPAPPMRRGRAATPLQDGHQAAPGNGGMPHWPLSRDVPTTWGHLVRNEMKDRQPRSDRCVEAPPVSILLKRLSAIANPPEDPPSSTHPRQACPGPKKVEPATARNTHINTEPIDRVHGRPSEPTDWRAGTIGQDSPYRGIPGERLRQHLADRGRPERDESHINRCIPRGRSAPYCALPPELADRPGLLSHSDLNHSQGARK